MTTLGWLIAVAGIVGGIWVLRARAAAAEAAGRAGAPAAPGRNQYLAVLVALVAGIGLIVAGASASSRLVETLAWDRGKEPGWLVSKKDATQWDPTSGRLKLHLEPDSNAYAIAPVDWNADAFRAEFDVEVDKITTSKNGRGNIAVGLFDGSLADIEDTDHVSGSTIQVTFGAPDASGNALWLRVSDANLLVHSDPARGETNKQPLQLEPGKTYHAVMAYNRRDEAVTLSVSEAGSNRPLVERKVEDLKDFTPNVAYFGVSMKGYKKGKDDKPKPFAEGWLSNVRFFQP